MQLGRGDDVVVSWMWADAKVLPGLHFLASINPLRWSTGPIDTVRGSQRTLQRR